MSANRFHSIKPGVVLGAYVRTTVHGYTGRVTGVHFGCPEDDAWKAAQRGYDVAAEEKKTARWVSILVNGGGAVVVPETLAEPIEPFTLRNDYAFFTFGEGEPDNA